MWKLGPVDKQKAEYEALLVGIAVRQALAEDRAIKAGLIPEPVQPLVPFALPEL